MDDYRSLVFYLALFLIFGSLAEIYVRKREAVKVEKNSRGKIVSNSRSIRFPILLLIAAILTSLAARYWH